MWRPSHINMTIFIALMTFIKIGYFSIYFLFVPFLAILPDLDHHNSYWKRKLWFRLPFAHRWFTHSLWFILLVIFIINIIWFYFYWWLNNINSELFSNFYNYVFELKKIDNLILFILLHWHILWDMITKDKVRYFTPISNVRIWINLMSTSEWKDKYWTTKEMYINFIITILNILAIIFIIKNFWVYENTIKDFITTLSWYNKEILISIFLSQLIFSIYLFWIDIKKTITHFKDFLKRIIKVLLFVFLWILTSWLLIFLISILQLNIFETYNNLQLIIYLIIMLIFWLFSLYLTKKYLISISYTTSYLINSIYILLMSIIITIWL